VLRSDVHEQQFDHSVSEGQMNKLIEENLLAVLRREGLEAKAGDLIEFGEIIELYMENLRQLHSVNLGAEEPGPVFRPEWTEK
jgi:hypothetical protein